MHWELGLGWSQVPPGRESDVLRARRSQPVRHRDRSWGEGCGRPCAL